VRAGGGDRHPGTSATADVRALLAPWTPAAPPPDPAELRSDRMHVLDKLRARASQVVLGEADPDGVVRVDPAVLARQVADWPEWVIRPASVGCYVQAWEDGPELRLVFNNAHGGHGRGRSRLGHQLSRARAGTRVSTGMDAGMSAGVGGVEAPAHRGAAVLAEWGGLMRWTLNVRLPGVPYEIDYPYSVSGRPAAERIPLADLRVVHDPGTDLAHLFSARLQARVVPLHLGMLAEFGLPPAARFADRAFGTAWMTHPSIPPLLAGQNWKRLAPGWDTPSEVIRYPRVEAGRVVLHRARWLVPAGRIPRRARGESDADFLLRMVAWLRREAVPDRVFVRASTGDGFSGEKIKARKPVYVDFANPWSVADFERQAAAGDFVIFEEALPDPGEGLGLGRGTDEARVTEFLVEITDDDESEDG